MIQAHSRCCLLTEAVYTTEKILLQVQYRYLIKQINENLKRVQQKKRGLEILESIMSEVQSDSESEYDDADDEDADADAVAGRLR